MRINKKKYGVVLAYLTQFVTILSGLLYTPVMLRLIGQSEYGLYQLVSSVISSLSLLSLGFSSSYVRFYTIEKTNGDDKRVARFNGMFLSIFIFLSLICLICGIVMVKNVRWVFGAGLTEREYVRVRILMAFMVISLVITFINTVFDCAISAHEEFVFQKFLALLRSLLNPFICIPLLIYGAGSVGMVAVSLGLNIAGLIANYYFCKKKLKMRFLFGRFDWRLLKDMWKFTFFIFLNQIIDQINWSMDKFLLGHFLNTNAVAVYGVASTINTMYINLSTAVSNIFVPSVNWLVAQNADEKEVNGLFIKVGRIQYCILMLVLTGFIFFGEYFISIWAGQGFEEAYITVLLLIIPVTVPLIQNLGIEIQRAKNKHQVRSIVYAFMAIVNVFLSIGLIKNIGFYGAATGTAVVLVLSNVLFMNWYYAKYMGMNIKKFWWNILDISKAFGVPVLTGIWISVNIQFKGIIDFFAGVAVYAIVYIISIWFWGMNEDERKLCLCKSKREN